LAKKSWCCKRSGRACDPYDCREGVGVANSKWTPAKEAWCCQEKGVRCTTTTPAPYNCLDRLSTWEHSWDGGKKAWCCKKQAIPTCDPFDCKVGAPLQIGSPAWPADKRDWCCRHRSVGCTTTPDPRLAKFDCKAELDNWEEDWLADKKTWCCQNMNQACDAYNCFPGFANRVDTWPVIKKQWCCQHRSEGCPATTRRPPLPSEYGGIGGDDLNCMYQLEVAKTMWSPQKKVLCCTRENKGCPERPARKFEATQPLRLSEASPTLRQQPPRGGLLGNLFARFLATGAAPLVATVMVACGLLLKVRAAHVIGHIRQTIFTAAPDSSEAEEEALSYEMCPRSPVRVRH